MYQTDANETRTTFAIPEANWAKFAANIEKLSRKSVKLIGEKIQPVVLGYEFKKDSRGRDYKAFQVLLTAAVPRVDGWTFVARLDHSQEAGTLVRMVPNSGELPLMYRDCQPNCDHCGLRRRRRDTFVLRNDAGQHQQVGATCLQDFFGHDASEIAAVAEYLTYAWETARGSEQLSETGMVDRRYVNLEEFLGYAARSVRKHGYVSAKAVREDSSLTSTRSDALNDMYSGHVANLGQDDLDTAEKALAYIRSECERPDLNDYMHNVSVIVKSQMIESRHCGIAASIIACYVRHVERTAQRAAAIQVDMSGIIGLFNTARSRLKNPAIVLLTSTANGRDDAEIRLTVAGPTAKVPGSINVTSLGSFENRDWYGRINLDGSFAGRPTAPAGLNATLQAFAADPAKVAAEYGRRTGNCCFCRKSLTDDRSTEVGYGGTCAKKYGLAWGNQAKREFRAEAA